jgi:DNA primase
VTGVAGAATAARRRLSDADFRRLLDELKARVRMSGVVGRKVKLQRTGKEWKACCPFHQEKTPSFTVVDALEWAHCFGCGWHGDVIQFVMDVEGCDFREAYRRLAADDLPEWTPQERAKAQAEERLDSLGNEKEARRFYAEAAPVRGTPGEVYLRARGITVELPDTVRFGMVPTKRGDDGQWNRPRPALVCGAQDASGCFVGIQRIYFKGDDPALGKADCKLSLGSCRGSALRLGPPAATIITPEGPEDGFSIFQEQSNFPVWVPFGTSMLPQVQFPPVVRRIIIAGQNNTAGRLAVAKATLALIDRGLEAAQTWPAPAYDDWNDMLRGVTR